MLIYDLFKEINDFYGNDIGDFLLISMANRLKSLLSKSGYNAYKLQADEYAVFMDKVTTNEEIDVFVENLWTGISERAFYYGGNQILITVAIGVSIGRSEENIHLKNKPAVKKWENITVHADMALKKAKKTQIHHIIYNESLEISKEYENNINWTRKLREAIKQDRIVPYFQPIVNNLNGRIEKQECLVRLIDNGGDIISPIKFLDVAKKSRFYHEITRIVVEKSLKVFQNQDFEFSINLSVIDILDEKTKAFIYQMLTEHKDISRNIVFEILESEGIQNYREVKEFINIVKGFGCKIAIDDFGSGYSNFIHIMKLNVDYIKIDSSIIENIDTDQYSQIIAKNITNVAKELGLKTIAEYVHSREVFEKILEIQVDYSQGYYFGKPSVELIK